MLKTGDVGAARTATDTLAAIAQRSGASLLLATAARAEGDVRLAMGDARGALASLRQAAVLWQQLDAPYELARVRMGIGLACRALGDTDAATMELEAARRVFAGLGAAPDLASVDTLLGKPVERPGGLTGREAEVLRLLAGGKTNREIAADLGISERTVDRHVSNVYLKLELSSRAAATAYAYEHGLI